MVDDYTEWNPAHNKADILVHYFESQKADNLNNEVEIQIYLFARNYVGQSGVLNYTEAIEDALKNQRPKSATDKLEHEKTKFIGQKKNIWSYIISFTTKVLR